ncbi:hypothetical protein QVD17_39820 [Tagetes erecta]|uniref:Uncharacterized protein n=1 Tax=Tagetes erecta TaxID=13708 RepID=A0AAD8JP92_TARER|nr:hypothetical protein QVD17_39820 [Tagetes erecta]
MDVAQHRREQNELASEIVVNGEVNVRVTDLLGKYRLAMSSANSQANQDGCGFEEEPSEHYVRASFTCAPSNPKMSTGQIVVMPPPIDQGIRL